MHTNRHRLVSLEVNRFIISTMTIIYGDVKE